VASFPLLTQLYSEGKFENLNSLLNSTNDFQVFYETWENVVKVGGDSYAVTTTVCPSGVVAVPGSNPISCA